MDNPNQGLPYEREKFFSFAADNGKIDPTGSPESRFPGKGREKYCRGTSNRQKPSWGHLAAKEVCCMKIRLQGSLPELDAAVELLRLGFEVQSVSKPYKNRNDDQYRVYIDAEPKKEK